MKTFTANGLKFAALEWGTPAAPLVLLVHGFPDTADSWTVLGPQLADGGFHVVAPFLRGYAPSALPERDTDLRTLATDVAEWAAVLGEGQPVHLVGHDWGAEAAYGAVGLAASRFRSLTTIGIPHRATLKPSLRLAWGLRHFAELTLPGAEGRFARDDFAMMEKLIKRWSPDWKYGAAELEPVRACFRQPGVVHAALGYYRAASAFTPDFMRAKVQVPALCVVGADDPALRASDYEPTRAHFAKGMEILSIRGGHFCHREAPEQLIGPLLAHLR
ncbi:MAG: alpha/beta fold hydrolase [Myxococcaceae bacterium]